MDDTRFIPTDFSMTEYDIMDKSGIFTALERLPKYHDQVENLKAIKREKRLEFFVKPTILWNL